MILNRIGVWNVDIGKEDALRLVEKAIEVWAADEINIYTEKGK